MLKRLLIFVTAMKPARSLAIAGVVFLAPAANAAQSCAALAKFAMLEHRVVIGQAQEIKASAPGTSPTVPAHCRVDGVIDERTSRDGKPYGIGFAVASTDSGHQGTGFDGSCMK